MPDVFFELLLVFVLAPFLALFAREVALAVLFDDVAIVAEVVPPVFACSLEEDFDAFFLDFVELPAAFFFGDLVVFFELRLLPVDFDFGVAFDFAFCTRPNVRR